MRFGRRAWLLAIPVLLGLSTLPSIAHAAGALNLNPDLARVGLNVALFVALIYPTHRWILQPLLRIFDERERRTTGAATDAQALVTEAAEVRVQFERRMHEARARAQRRRAEILAEAEESTHGLLDVARTEASASLEEVRQTIAGELDEARQGLRDQTEVLAREVAEKVLGRSL